MEVEAVVFVIAAPETLNISEDGLYTNVVLEDTAKPEAEPKDGVNNNG